MNVRDFEKCFNAWYLPVCMYVLRMCNDRHEAEDIASETFAKAWEYLSCHDAPFNIKAFIYRMAHNIAIDHLRARHQYAELNELNGVPAEDIDTSERDAAIWKAVGSLPDRCRQIFVMSKRDNLSHKEIAEDLGISEKTVENQLTKAFKTLRNALRRDPTFRDYSFILIFL